MQNLIGRLMLCVFALSIAACSQQKTEITVGYLPIAAELPFFVAIEEGYFSDENLEIELVRMASSNDLANAATAGRVDVLAGSASNVVFDVGTTSGKSHKLFLLNPYSNEPGHVTDHLLVGNAEEYPDIPSLRGRRIASFPGSVNRIFVKLIFEKHGLEWGEYEYLEMLPQNWQPSLASGSVDAVSALEPSATQIILDGIGESIFPGFYADLMPNVPLSGHWFAADFVETADRATLEGFLRAYERAVDFIRNDPEVAKQYLVEYANVREDVLQQVGLNPWMKLDEINASEIQSFADLLADQGALLESVDVTNFIFMGNQSDGKAVDQAE